MIVEKTYTRGDGVTLIRRYSDEGVMLYQDQTGYVYTEVVDVEDSGFTYTETDIPIEDEIDDIEALRILLGGEVDE